MRHNDRRKLPRPANDTTPDSPGCRAYLHECFGQTVRLGLGHAFCQETARDHYHMGLDVETYVETIQRREAFKASVA